MENLITLVNKIQRACTALGDHGEASALPTLWDSLPAIAVVGGQVSRCFFFFLKISALFDRLLSLFSFDLSAVISFIFDLLIICLFSRSTYKLI